MAALEDSSAGRLIGVLVSPARTFQSIAARPTWGVALVVLALLGVGLGQLINARTDQRQMMEKQLAKFGQHLSPEELDKAVARAKNPSPVLRALSLVTGLLFQSLIYLVPAALFFIFFKLAGSELTFKSSFSTYLYSTVPIAIGLLLTLPVILSRRTVQPVDAMTGRLLASSPSFFLPEGSSAALRGALSSFDVFNLWSVVLAVVGYRIVARVSTTAAVAAAIVLFLIGMGLRVLAASFMG
ncbi:MAG: YIP1 family protein [Thermoanaerobaculia bacterium]